jgi:hypothetical protein
MPGTVDDFVRRFGGSGSLDEREATQYFDRFASTDPNDRDFDNDTMYQGSSEYLGQLPQDQFQRAASDAFQHAPPEQKQGLLGGLLGGLRNSGENMSSLQKQLGLKSMDPQRMGPNDYARIANFARTQHPEVIQQQVKEQPWLLKAMGNPIVLGALGLVAARMLKNRARP